MIETLITFMLANWGAAVIWLLFSTVTYISCYFYDNTKITSHSFIWWVITFVLGSTLIVSFLNALIAIGLVSLTLPQLYGVFLLFGVGFTVIKLFIISGKSLSRLRNNKHKAGVMLDDRFVKASNIINNSAKNLGITPIQLIDQHRALVFNAITRGDSADILAVTYATKDNLLDLHSNIINRSSAFVKERYNTFCSHIDSVKSSSDNESIITDKTLFSMFSHNYLQYLRKAIFEKLSAELISDTHDQLVTVKLSETSGTPVLDFKFHTSQLYSRVIFWTCLFPYFFVHVTIHDVLARMFSGIIKSIVKICHSFFRLISGNLLD